jgi:hypothetical protein
MGTLYPFVRGATCQYSNAAGHGYATAVRPRVPLANTAALQGMGAISAGGSWATVILGVHGAAFSYGHWAARATVILGGSLGPLLSSVVRPPFSGRLHALGVPTQRGGRGDSGDSACPDGLPMTCSDRATERCRRGVRGTVSGRTPGLQGGTATSCHGVRACLALATRHWGHSGSSGGHIVAARGIAWGRRDKLALLPRKSAAKNLGGGPSRGGSRLGVSP